MRNSAARIRPRFSTAVITTFDVLVGERGRIDFPCVTGLNSAQNVKDEFSHILVAVFA